MPTAPAWHAPPSAFDGFAVQVDEIGGRRSAVPGPGWTMPVGVSSLKTGAVAPPSKCPVKVRFCAADVLLPADVRRVARERDVGPCCVVQRVRDRLARVERARSGRLRRGATRRSRAFDADLLGPGDPRHRRPSGSQRAGGDARILGVDGGVLVERARALLAAASRRTRRSGACRRWCPARWSARPCRCRPRPSGSRRPRSAVGDGLGREHQLVGDAVEARALSRTRRPTEPCRTGR